MSGTGGIDGSGGEPGERRPVREIPTREYFEYLERLIIELRGAPLLLAPKEWQVAKAWRDEGIPLDLVEDTLRDLAGKMEEKGDDRPMTLSYCKRAVRAAWKRQGQLQAPAVPVDLPGLEPAGRLAALAAGLPAGLEDPWGPRIRALAGAPDEIELELGRLEGDLLAEVVGSWTEAEVAALETELESALAALSDRLPAGEIERARGRLRARLVRERAGLPVLSLFG